MTAFFDMEAHLNVTADIKVKFLDKSYKHYLNRSTILFGASDSGKSTVLIEILYLLKEHVPNIFVFSPTAEDNNAFTGIVPDPLIYKTVDVNVLEAIYMRQKAATRIYNTVNNLQSLRAMFSRVATSKDVESAKTAYVNAIHIIQRKESDPSIGFADKKHAISEVKRVRDAYLTKLYKNVVRSNKQRLKNMRLTDVEKYVVKYLDFNPNCVVVLDDCGAELKKFQKTEVYKKIMFQGRHNFINTVLTLQDDLGLESDIKKNAFVSVFTTAQCASAYFDRKSNSFLKKERDEAAKVIDSIFSEAGQKSFRKFVYLRRDPFPWRYTIADQHEEFRFGNASLWRMCDKLTRENKTCDFDSDPLLSAFKIDI